MIARRDLIEKALACAGAFALTGLTGCADTGAGAHKGADAVPVSWLKCRVRVPAAIDPALVADEAGRQIASQLFDPLMRVDAETGELVPAAAASYEVSDDARTFTFRLASGAQFHNGDAVDAAAFKRAWERLVAPLSTAEDVEAEEAARDADEGTGTADTSDASGAPHAPASGLLSLVEGYDALYAGRASTLAGVSCPDSQTLVVKLAEPYADFAWVTARAELSPVPAAALDDAEAFAAKPIGNGPFEMRRAWEPKKDVRLAPFDDYAGGAPTLEGVLFEVENDTAAAFKQFQAGNVDVCDVPAEQLEEIEESLGISEDARTSAPGARVVRTAEPGVYALMCNMRHPLLGVGAFRRAVSRAIDRESLCERELKRAFEPALGLLSPAVASDVPAWDVCSYDPDRAAELLDGLNELNGSDELNGLGETDGPAEPNVSDELDVSAEPDELDTSFTILCRTGGVMERVANFVAADLKAADIDATVETAAPEVVSERIALGDFDCVLLSALPESLALLASVEPLVGGTDSYAGLGGFYDEQVDAELAAARSAVGPEERAVRIQAALVRVEDELPLVPLMHPAHAKVTSERVESLAIDALGTPNLASAVL